MADNLNVTQGAGTIVRTDDVGGVHYQVVKLDLGGNGVSSPLALGQAAAASSIPVVLSTEQGAFLDGLEALATSSNTKLDTAIGLLGKSSTGATTAVASSATAVTVLASNANRKGATFYYDEAAILYLIFSSTTPTSSLYSVKMGEGFYTFVEVPAGYTGIVQGIWSSTVGSVVVTELT